MSLEHKMVMKNVKLTVCLKGSGVWAFYNQPARTLWPRCLWMLVRSTAAEASRTVAREEDRRLGRAAPFRGRLSGCLL